MRLDRDPDRSPSPVQSSSDDENINDDEAELLAAMAEKEAELNRTQELIDERNKQVEATLAELRHINNLMKQIETIVHYDMNSKH